MDPSGPLSSYPLPLLMPMWRTSLTEHLFLALQTLRGTSSSAHRGTLLTDQTHIWCIAERAGGFHRPPLQAPRSVHARVPRISSLPSTRQARMAKPCGQWVCSTPGVSHPRWELILHPRIWDYRKGLQSECLCATANHRATRHRCVVHFSSCLSQQVLCPHVRATGTKRCGNMPRHNGSRFRLRSV
jgi:hypothetical protein